MPPIRITLSIGVDLLPETDIETPRDAERRLQQLLDHAIPHNHPGVKIESVPPAASYPSKIWQNPLTEKTFDQLGGGFIKPIRHPLQGQKPESD